MGDERIDLEKQIRDTRDKCPVGMRPVYDEAVELAQRIARETDPKFTSAYLTFLVEYFKPPEPPAARKRGG